MSPKLLHQRAGVVAVPGIRSDDKRLWRALVRKTPADQAFVGTTPLISERALRSALTEVQCGFQANALSGAGHQDGPAMKIANHETGAAFIFSCIDA
jgi:hypothetical protein